MDNIFDSKFASYRQPAWHMLGEVFDEPRTAREAYQGIGPYNVELQDLVTVEGIKTDLRAIIRTDPESDPVVFGTVGPRYTLVTPAQAVDIWDASVKRPIETIGALGNGETLFVTTKLPKYDVRGDEIEDYLLAVFNMTGYQANQIMDTPVRTVCQNTLIAAQGAAAVTFNIRHDEEVEDNLRVWMGEMMEGAVERAAALREAFLILADKTLTKANAQTALKKVYPDPKQPRLNAPPEIMEQRMEWFEQNKKWAERTRESVFTVFDGAGTGMQTKAAKGTAWGLYNAVVEYEDFRKGGTLESSRLSTLLGDRASYKRAAFTVLSGVK